MTGACRAAHRQGPAGVVSVLEARLPGHRMPAAYRAGVREWCASCDQHGLPCLPTRAADVVAFPSAERGQGRNVNIVELPYDTTELGPIRALPRIPAGGGRDRRRRCVSADLAPAARPRRLEHPLPRVGTMAIDAGTIARVIHARAAQVRYDANVLGGHSLKRGALSTGMDRNILPTRL
jgi:hypothetical protein